jgi:bifunctional DNA-binding transcriptional regulator/antitoxin component of YhaV-PrlF toxin-antitoxin module
VAIKSPYQYKCGKLTGEVEADEKGRILLPVEMRQKFKSRRFEVTIKGDVVELRPLPAIEELRGKYRDVIHSEWEDLERKAEELVSDGKR